MSLPQTYLAAIGGIARGAAILEYLVESLTSMLISPKPGVGSAVLGGQNYDRSRKLAVDVIKIRFESDDRDAAELGWDLNASLGRTQDSITSRNTYLHSLWGVIETGDFGMMRRGKKPATVHVSIEQLTSCADAMEILIKESGPLLARLDAANHRS